MNAPGNNTYLIHINQQGLQDELDWLRGLLKNATSESTAKNSEPPGSATLTLDFLAERFQLSSFERAIILLCAGIELHSDIGPLCSKVLCNIQQTYPTFGLALSALPEPHWSALAPESPLRYWQLIHIDDSSRLTTGRLTLDESILHFLMGVPSLDHRLAGVVQPLNQSTLLAASQLQRVEKLVHLWRDSSKPPVILIQGDDTVAGLAVAAHASTQLGLRPVMLRAYDIPAAAEERNLLVRLLTREYLLSRTVPVITNAENPPSYLTAFVEQLECPLMLLGDRPPLLQQSFVTVEVNKPTTVEQRSLWCSGLSDLEDFDEAELLPLASQFNFSSAEITTSAETVQAEVGRGKPLNHALWHCCRRHSRGGLDHLAQRITSHVGWDDLILPKGKKDMLRAISRQVRHRATVYEAWGFAEKSERGLGISALFTGESGTGKTMAAEVLAADLNLDLYRIDLSSVVSKYIGETEKNLEQLFRAAETSGAILLFDEADALFGKRSEVKDSHDRYANIELAYLLQRMESYRGLSILTSNMKSALDTAFLRRIRFVVQFPYPDVTERSAIWQRVFPDSLPRAELKITQLARLHVAGGNIRNIALNGAFLAAEKGEPLSMVDLVHAARMEYAKMEKPLNDAELRKWT